MKYSILHKWVNDFIFLSYQEWYFVVKKIIVLEDVFYFWDFDGIRI